jgi:hypothetical protein
MKNISKRMVIATTLIAMMAVAALAKIQKESISLAADVNLNGTVLKKGNYDVRIDDQTGEVSILKDGKVVAKATARQEKRDAKARDTKVTYIIKDGANELTKLTFAGADHDFVLGPSNGQTAAK